MKKNVLVLNMGMKSIRCIIFDESGRKISSAALAISTAINEDCVEQDPDEWWDKAIQVMRKACVDAKIRHIDYITVTASASCLICVDNNGAALEKAIMVSDKRAVAEAKEISGLPEYLSVFSDTGLDISVSLMLPKILWVKKNEPDIFEQTRYFMTPNDFLVFKLCGSAVTDELNASKYHYDLQKEMYPGKMLTRLGIPESKLPRVAFTGTDVGGVLASVADVIGIGRGARVILTSYDAICSFVGSGVCGEGEASDVSGTVTVFRTLSKKTQIGKSSRIYNVRFRQGGFNIVGGSNNLGGGLIEWVKQCYYLKEEYPYEVMEKEAGESEIGARGVVFLPYLLGERAPLWNNDARGVFFGLERMHSRKDMTRAVFESTAFIDRNFEEVISEEGIKVSTVRLSGGLARVSLISQIKADVLGKDVIVLSEFETTASGAAMIALHGQGVFDSLEAAAAQFTSVRMIIKPNMENHKKYDLMYELFKKAYEVNLPLFKERVQLMGQIRDNRETRIENL